MNNKLIDSEYNEPRHCVLGGRECKGAGIEWFKDTDEKILSPPRLNLKTSVLLTGTLIASGTSNTGKCVLTAG